MKKPVIEMRDICFSANGAQLLQDVDFCVYQGEICGLIGENGAGKTVLMKILSGAYQRDSGKILVNGQEVSIDSVIDAQKHGIRMIYHEDNLIPEFSVLENIFLGNNITYDGRVFVNKKEQRRIAKEVMSFFGRDFDLSRKTSKLNTLEKKIIELIRAVVFNSKLLVLDEILANCNLYEGEILFDIIRKISQLGISIVFISHRMDDVLRICDRVLILTDGKVLDQSIEECTLMDLEDVLLKMAGKEAVNRYPRTNVPKGSVVLEAKNIALKDTLIQDVSMYLRKGEIVGITGLYGAGNIHLIHMLAGVSEPTSGEVFLDGISTKGRQNTEYVRQGIAYIGNDGSSNLVTDLDVKNNISLSNLRQYTKAGFLDRTKILYTAKDFIARLHLTNVRPSSDVTTLSRGTQQKVTLSKWIHANSKVLIFDDPSGNLDVVSKVEFYNILNALTTKGKAILLSSTDLAELNGMCDRIYVLYKGNIIAEFDKESKSLLKILQAVTGQVDPQP